LPEPYNESNLSSLQIDGVGQKGAILRAKITEKRLPLIMKRNSRTLYSVNLVEINRFLAQLDIQEAKDGIVYSGHGWDIKLQIILEMASHFRTG
jgi:hypothetical protein